MDGLSYGDKSVLSYTRHDATFPGFRDVPQINLPYLKNACILGTV